MDKMQGSLREQYIEPPYSTKKASDLFHRIERRIWRVSFGVSRKHKQRGLESMAITHYTALRRPQREKHDDDVTGHIG